MSSAPTGPPEPTTSSGFEGGSGGAAAAKVAVLPVRLVQVFVSPGELFDRLRERPVWLDMLLFLIAVNVLATVLLPEDILRRIVLESLPANAEAAQIEGAVRVSRTLGPVIAVLGAPIAITVVAGILIVGYNVVLGGEASFRQIFSVTTHAFWVLTVGSLLTLGLLVMGGSQVVLSPALLLPDLGDGYFARFLGKINIFAIFTSIVLGIGVSRIYPRRSAAGATAYLLVLYALLIGVSAIPGG